MAVGVKLSEKTLGRFASVLTAELCVFGFLSGSDQIAARLSFAFRNRPLNVSKL